MPRRRKKLNLGPIIVLLVIISIVVVGAGIFLYGTLPSFTYEIWAGTKMTTGVGGYECEKKECQIETTSNVIRGHYLKYVKAVFRKES